MGGYGGHLSFQVVCRFAFLARSYRRQKNQEAWTMLEKTLLKMALGGVYDHVAGGFHRYSVDAEWLVPHFEKMLYDNALLALSYVEGYQLTKNPNFKRVVEETLDYIRRDMTSPEGGFYSATDADSINPQGQRDEGYFFTWTPEELHEVLGQNTADVIRAYFSMTEEGNFEGRNILHVSNEASSVAAQFFLSEQEFDRVLQNAKKMLYQVRKARKQPLRDEKILTAWNGLTISAFARAGRVLDRADYIQTALNAAQFLKRELWVGERLLRSHKDEVSRHRGYLDDYSSFIAGLLDLFEATMQFEF